VDQPKYEGVTVTLAGEKYVVPQLSFKSWQVHEALIREFWKVQIAVLEAKEKGTAPVDVPFLMRFLPIAHAAIARNYPSVTLERLEDELEFGDLGEFTNALVAALSQGKERKPRGEALAVAS
jgi:hypothetical protein